MVLAALLVSAASLGASGDDFPRTGGAQVKGGGWPDASDFKTPSSDSKGDFGGNEFTRTNPPGSYQGDVDQSAAAADGDDQKANSNVEGKNAPGEGGGLPAKDKSAADAAGSGAAAVPNDDDVRENFETVVKDYAAKKSPKGYWPYQEKGGKPWRLKSLALDPSLVKKTSSGLYEGSVTMRDARTGHSLTLVFVVDFSEVWKVVSVKSRPSKPAKSR